MPGFAVRAAPRARHFAYAKLPMVKDLENSSEGWSSTTSSPRSPATSSPAGRAAGAGPGGPPIPARIHAPADEFLVLDADSTQNYAINAVLAGQHLVVKGPPGTGKSQTSPTSSRRWSPAASGCCSWPRSAPRSTRSSKRLDQPRPRRPRAGPPRRQQLAAKAPRVAGGVRCEHDRASRSNLALICTRLQKRARTAQRGTSRRCTKSAALGRHRLRAPAVLLGLDDAAETRLRSAWSPPSTPTARRVAPGSSRLRHPRRLAHAAERQSVGWAGDRQPRRGRDARFELADRLSERTLPARSGPRTSRADRAAPAVKVEDWRQRLRVPGRRPRHAASTSTAPVFDADLDDPRRHAD